MTKSNQTIHMRCNICEMMIPEEDLVKHINVKEHQIKKKALEYNITDLKSEDGYSSVISKWRQELSPQ